MGLDAQTEVEMERHKRIGMLAILAGLALALVPLVLATGYNPARGFLGSLPEMQIVLQYKLFLATGILITLAGIAIGMGVVPLPTQRNFGK